MVLGYEVLEDGTLNEVELSKDDLVSTIVVCVVDDETKSIYLWKGSQAGVRRKFIGARVATNLRTEYGFHFKVRPLDEGEEPPTFFTALDGSTSATRVLKPGETAPPPAPPRPRTEDATETSSAPPPVPKPKTETTPITPQTTTPEPRTTPTPPIPKPSSPPIPRQTAPITTGPVGEVADMIREMEGIDPPEGYQRELVIVYNDLYTVAEHKTAVFGQEKIERRIEKVKDPPEGTFMAEGFIPRVIVKEGRVLGIELLKGTPDAILSPIKAEMKERLSDLITFFKSETGAEDADSQSSKGKSKKGKKLVAK
ncbi:hypothetical protein EU528_05340 [Candidatus Thorarchaeota archaeon]|nr:MAG: hypothetical protein EU528_05340 [Candidatus Thorarchaeota archaeon]